MANVPSDAIDPEFDEQPAQSAWPSPVAFDRDFVRRRRAERRSLLTRAGEILGEPLAEVILTHQPEHRIGLAAAASALSDEELMPLRNALSVALDLSERASPSTIQAWFVGLNPILDDQEPALVVRSNPTAVRQAARAFLAGGW